MKLLENIKLPEGLKKLSTSELEKLAEEIRAKIIDVVSKCGGHLSTSLGAVELCLCLHTIFESPRDKLIWDVGHQTYAHKILTGRLKEFETLRQYKGISGFPRKGESAHDIFTVGHASTSISTALGIAKARDLSEDNFSVVAMIGDASIVGGMAQEAINNILSLKERNFIIVLNDNEMSISKSVGVMANYLTGVRTSPWYTGTKDRIERLASRIPRIGVPVIEAAARFKDRVKHFLIDFKVGVIFEELGFKYLGPIDGHNIPLLLSTLHFAREVKGPVLIHILTKKGKGYPPAETNPTFFHSAPPFDIATGKPKAKKKTTYTSIFGETIARLGKENPKIIGITAAMIDGTGLDEFAKKFPDRFFDVGIAEEHAITFAAGLSSQGYKPVAAIYSTFLQRAYDQIIHDICLQNLPMVFILDRAGIVGEDGPTHNGVFDLAYLRHIPNMVVMAPKDENELQHMVYTAVNHNGPIAVRYHRGAGPGAELDTELIELKIGKGEVAHKLKTLRQRRIRLRRKSAKRKVLILSIGSMVYPSIEAAKILEGEGIGCSVINARFVKPLDKNLIAKSAENVDFIITVEEGCLQGGFGSAVLELLEQEKVYKPTKLIGLPDEFIEHGRRDKILEIYGLTSQGIAEAITQLISS